MEIRVGQLKANPIFADFISSISHKRAYLRVCSELGYHDKTDKKQTNLGIIMYDLMAIIRQSEVSGDILS